MTIIIKRIKAFVLDYFITAFFVFILTFLGLIVGLDKLLETTLPIKYFSVMYWLFIFFLLSKDSWGNQSIGKMFIGIEINKNNLKYSNIWGNFIRNLPILIWPIDLLMLIFTKKRIADNILGTYIDETKDWSLKTILQKIRYTKLNYLFLFFLLCIVILISYMFHLYWKQFNPYF